MVAMPAGMPTLMHIRNLGRVKSSILKSDSRSIKSQSLERRSKIAFLRLPR
jgi:hypothetical protein